MRVGGDSGDGVLRSAIQLRTACPECEERHVRNMENSMSATWRTACPVCTTFVSTAEPPPKIVLYLAQVKSPSDSSNVSAV